MKKMTRADILKEQFPELTTTFLDLLKVLDPSDQNTYLEFLSKYTSDRLNTLQNIGEINGELINVYRIDENKIYSISLIKRRILLSLLGFFSSDDIRTLNEFHNRKVKNKLIDSDITKLKSFDDMRKVISISQIKDIDKDLEKSVIKLHEDDTWLVLKPLTHLSSMKYGANTKWCTTAESYDHFERYSTRGILIYSMNKKTGDKVATFYSIKNNSDELYSDPIEFSFWDQKDNRIDSLQSDLPRFILDLIFNETRTCTETNFDLLSPDEKLKELQYYNNYGRNTLRAVPQPSVVDELRLNGNEPVIPVLRVARETPEFEPELVSSNIILNTDGQTLANFFSVENTNNTWTTTEW